MVIRLGFVPIGEAVTVQAAPVIRPHIVRLVPGRIEALAAVIAFPALSDIGHPGLCRPGEDHHNGRRPIYTACHPIDRVFPHLIVGGVVQHLVGHVSINLLGQGPGRQLCGGIAEVFSICIFQAGGGAGAKRPGAQFQSLYCSSPGSGGTIWPGIHVGKPMNRAVGGGLPAVMWRDLMMAAHAGKASYTPERFAEEGFIHCTNGDERLIEVGNRYYTGDARPFLALLVDLGAAGSPARSPSPPTPRPRRWARGDRRPSSSVAPGARGGR